MQPYIGQLLLVGFNFPPVGWAFCDGSVLSIAQYDILFSLLGTTYGGDGVNNFALPDLRSRTPVGGGQLPGGGNYIQGTPGGAERVTIGIQTYPTHTHNFQATSATGTANSPAGAILASQQTIYAATPSFNAQLAQNACGPSTGNSIAHENRQPLLALNWIIATEGVYPSQN